MSRKQELDFEELRKRIFGGQRKNIKTLQIYRDACRRSHRILGAYLAMWAWKKRVDCVALDRAQSLRHLSLEAMREVRLEWLDEDIKDLFPYQEVLVVRNNVYGSLYLSRKPFPRNAFEEKMPDARRVMLLSKLGVRASILKGRLPSEERMITVLASAATGGGRPKSVRRKRSPLDGTHNPRTSSST